MRDLEEIRRTPVTLLTDEEVDMLSDEQTEHQKLKGWPSPRQWAKNARARAAKEAACPGHERVETATREQARRGNHRGECKHCGKDMSYDSGD